MMNIKKIQATAIVFIASSMFSVLLFAGAADMESADGNKMKFEYEGDNLRINTGQEGRYIVINDDGVYMVNNSDGQLMVIDAGKMMGMFGDLASTAPSVASSEIVSLEATGKRENYAGMKGEVYKLEYVDQASDQVQTTDLVLSDDPRAIQLTRAITNMAAAMVKATGQNAKGANELQEYMAKMDKGVLRYGKDMWVAAISDRRIASERFVLPAEPTDLSGMSGIADAMRQAGSSQTGSVDATANAEEQPKKKGLVSGFLSKFSKKADDQAAKQQDRVADEADGAVDDATDEAVDNALDKALDKLFGN